MDNLYPSAHDPVNPQDFSQPWPMLDFIITLIAHPEKIITAIRFGTLENREIFLKSFLFLLAASLCFAVYAEINYPVHFQFTPSQLVIRFFVTFGLMLIVLIPLFTLGWSLLQKLSCWFFNLNITYKTVLGIAGLGIFYYALIFVLGVPVAFLKSFSPIVAELLLLGLNIGAFILSIRLFKNSYAILGNVSGKKALWISTFPIVILLGLYIVLQLMVYFAMHPHYKMH